MAADAVLAEALSRLEHKVDLLMHLIAGNFSGAHLQLGDPNHICPVCQSQVTYRIDIANKVAIRSCKCSTGLQAPIDLGAYSPPVIQARKDVGNGPEEDGDDSSGRRRIHGR